MLKSRMKKILAALISIMLIGTSTSLTGITTYATEATSTAAEATDTATNTTEVATDTATGTTAGTGTATTSTAGAAIGTATISTGTATSALATTYTDSQGVIYNLDNTKKTASVCSVYSQVIKTLEIPEEVNANGEKYSVTSIGNEAFYGCGNLTSITIPNSVITIGSSLFIECRSLTSITIPSSVTSINEYAFDNGNLASINVDSNNKNYSSEDGVLFNKTKTMLLYYPRGNKQSSYTIPSTVTCIGNYSFQLSSSLTNITIPSSVTSIGYDAFYECGNLTSITIPNSVTYIGYTAFFRCTSLTSITIPSSVTSIGDGAFSECPNLTSITVDSNNKNYLSEDGVLFNKDKTTLKCYPIGNKQSSYTIPNSITTIGYMAFIGCCGKLLL